MAHNSTSRRRFGAAVGAFGVSVVAAAALVGMAGTASAHTPKLTSDCSEEGSWLKVELTKYNDRDKNTVTVAIDDEVRVDEEFGKSFKQTFDGLDPAASHTAVVVVEAWDDPDANKGFSFTKELTIEACVEPSTPPEEPSTPTETPSEPAPTSSEAAPPVATEETTPVPTTSVEVEEAALAETGASVAIPLGIGAVLLAGGVVLMVVVRRRGRADHQA